MRAILKGIVSGLSVALVSGTAMGDPPPPDHIVIVIEENKADDEVIGSPGTPYINSLANGGARLANMYALTHPSQPNYLHLFSGANQGVFDNDNPAAGTPFSTPNLGAALLAAGLTFSGYAEDLPEVGSTAPDEGVYARRHNPWVNWQADPPGPNQLSPSLNKPFFTSGPNPLPFFGEVNAPAEYGALPRVSFVVPNLINDMHDGSLKEADLWLEQNIGPYATWAMTHNSLLILTWDEDSNTSRNRIPTVLYGPMVRPGVYTSWWTLHDLLRTVEDLCGVAHSGAASQARPITGWQQGGPVLTTRVIRQGADGYWGAHDTYVVEASPNIPRGSSGLSVIDSFPQSQALVRFDDIVGGAANQIPAGATVYAAKLAVLTGRNSLLGDHSSDLASAYAMLSAWDDESTWNSMDGGVSTDDVEAKKKSDFDVFPNVLDAWAIFDVSDTVQAIVNGSAPNWGWVLSSNGTDAWRVFSSEASSDDDRPRLIVTFDGSSCQAAIGGQPAWTRADVGGTALFSVAAGGADPLSYQWRKDAEPLADGGSVSGSTSSTLAIAPVVETDAGEYDVIVTNPCGSVISNAAGLLVCPAMLMGDMNSDGIVNGDDVNAFSRAIIEGLTDSQSVCIADFSANGIVDPADVTRFLDFLLSP